MKKIIIIFLLIPTLALSETFKDEEGKLKYQSFGQCSKDELSDIIEVIIQMGEFLNMNLDPIL